MELEHWYNEIDPYAAAWLRNLIAAGHLPAGVVDERDIRDVAPVELMGYRQCHFFAGIGGWPLALRLAGWPDDRPVWTGSCPCQPFSAAGQRKGADDERHLWPAFRWLVDQCRPPVVFGEQVASKDGRLWLAGVRTDLERMAYAVGAADLCAAGAGAPHIRQRLFWMADAEHTIRRPQRRSVKNEHNGDDDGREETHCLAGARGPLRDSFWSSYDLIPCADGKARRVESGTFPLVDGSAFKLGSSSAFEGKSRVGMLRAYGNAIVPQVAAEFIGAFVDVKAL